MVAHGCVEAQGAVVHVGTHPAQSVALTQTVAASLVAVPGLISANAASSGEVAMRCACRLLTGYL